MEEVLFTELTSRRFSAEEARLITSAIKLIIDNTSVEPKSQELQQLIYALGELQK